MMNDKAVDFALGRKESTCPPTFCNPYYAYEDDKYNTSVKENKGNAPGTSNLPRNDSLLNVQHSTSTNIDKQQTIQNHATVIKLEKNYSEEDSMLKEEKCRDSFSSQSEYDKDRSLRLSKMSAYAAKRLLSETPEQRAVRLAKMSLYAARRLANETSEERALRLAKMSAYTARRLAAETPEQRAIRLKKMSAYSARRNIVKKITAHNTFIIDKES